VCRHGQDIDVAQLYEISRSKEVIDFAQLLPHGGGSHHYSVAPPNSRDVLFGEVVVVRVGQEDVVGIAFFRYSPWVYVDLHTALTDSDRRVPEPGDPVQEVVHGSSRKKACSTDIQSRGVRTKKLGDEIAGKKMVEFDVRSARLAGFLLKRHEKPSIWVGKNPA
jgi:hypothetical protein